MTAQPQQLPHPPAPTDHWIDALPQAVLLTEAGCVTRVNAAAARLLPGIALDRPLARHLAGGALESAAARLAASCRRPSSPAMAPPTVTWRVPGSTGTHSPCGNATCIRVSRLIPASTSTIPVSSSIEYNRVSCVMSTVSPPLFWPDSL